MFNGIAYDEPTHRGITVEEFLKTFALGFNKNAEHVADIEDEIVLLQSEKSYLEFTLESRMTLDQIESYAENQLGMVKMDASQKKYVELERENKIGVSESPVKEKLDEAIQPILSYLLP